jgi:hypothetical protein
VGTTPRQDTQDLFEEKNIQFSLRQVSKMKHKNMAIVQNKL